MKIELKMPPCFRIPVKYACVMDTNQQISVTPEQNHPLYASDRDRIDALLGHRGEPNEDQLTTAAMLLNRYDGFPGANDLQEDLTKVVMGWGLDREQLNAKTRAIWSSGWLPGSASSSEDVGSGADVVDKDA